jgi:cobyrinic acid a,c-diamide synthase
MSHLPRLAVGAVQSGADSQVMTWALMGALRHAGLDVQHFYGQACLAAIDGAASITGSGSRYLDSWLMAPKTCRELYVRAAERADISIVEGRFDAAGRGCACGGTLERLCDWLALPRLAVIDVARLAECQLPHLPRGTVGLLLDRVRGVRGLLLEQIRLEALLGAPVLGALPGLSHARRMIARLAHGSAPTSSICRELGLVFAQHARLDKLLELAERPYPFGVPQDRCAPRAALPDVRIAVAFDAAFKSYFHDALDQLERNGAEVLTFSPLKDEQVPSCDIIYLGTGCPERFAERLSGNQCMLSSLRSHFRDGRRIYAEGGGLAYLCEAMETLDGKRRPMAGIVSATARQIAASASRPVEITIARETWLAEAGTRVRGYASCDWELAPEGALASLALEPCHRGQLVASRGLVGSLLHINFAAQPRLLARFFEPWPQAARLQLAR